jgi:hypothetical protein
MAFRADAFEKHDKLELEKDHWIHARSSTRSIAVVHEVADKREIEHPIQMAVEVIGRHQLVE